MSGDSNDTDLGSASDKDALSIASSVVPAVLGSILLGSHTGSGPAAGCYRILAVADAPESTPELSSAQLLASSTG